MNEIIVVLIVVLMQINIIQTSVVFCACNKCIKRHILTYTV